MSDIPRSCDPADPAGARGIYTGYLSPDGTFVVAGGSGGFLRFWDTASERLLWVLQTHRSFVVGVHYEGSDLVTRGFAGDVARWALPPPEKIIEVCHADTCAPVATTEK